MVPEGSPNSKRIVEDIYRVVDESLMKVFYACGTAVKGVGTRRGRRNDLGLGKLPRGGRQMKRQQFKKRWLHDDAMEAFKEKMEKGKATNESTK